MSFLDTKIKLPLVTLFFSALFITMFGTLTAYGINADGTGFDKGITANYICAAFVFVILWLGYSFLLGTHKNWAGIVCQFIVALWPLTGLIGTAGWVRAGIYWGTIHYMPILSLFHATTIVGFIVMDAIVCVLNVVCFILGKKWKAAQAY